jgi:hypothetical protein
MLACQAQVFTKGFFFDRNDCVNSTLNPAVIEKRVSVRREVCDPVQIRKNPTTGRQTRGRGLNVTNRLQTSFPLGGGAYLSHTLMG